MTKEDKKELICTLRLW